MNSILIYKETTYANSAKKMQAMTTAGESSVSMAPGTEKSMLAIGDNMYCLIVFFLFFISHNSPLRASEFKRTLENNSAYAPMTYLTKQEKCCQYGKQFCAHGNNLGDLAKIDFAIYTLMTQEKIPNANIAIADGKGRLVKEVGYTNCQAFPSQISQRFSATKDSVYRYASLSKMLTGGIFALLEGRGEIDISNRISSYFPFPEEGIKQKFTQKNQERYNKLTLQQLFTHTSGWDRLESGVDPSMADLRISKEMSAPLPISFNDIFRYTLNHQPFQRDPGGKFSYSNWGYMLIERAIEKASKTDFYSYLKAELLRPLGMNSVEVAGNLPHEKAENEVDYFSASKKDSECQAPHAWPPMIKARYLPQRPCVPYSHGIHNFNNMIGAGGLRGSARDILLYFRQLQEHMKSQSIIPQSQITKLKRGFYVDQNFFYGHGIKRGRFQENDLHHTGSLEGTRNFAFLMENNKKNPRISELIVSFLANKDFNENIQTNFIKKLMFELLPSIEDWGDNDRNLFFQTEMRDPSRAHYDGEVRPKEN